MAKSKRKGVYARDIDQLNVVFALVGLGCLLSVGWMIWDDYAREWKDYQRQFRVIEREVAQQELQEVEAQIDQERLEQLRAERDSAEQGLATQQDEINRLEEELDQLEDLLDLATQRMRFARSIYDARRYEYEEAARHAQSVQEVANEREAMERAAADVAEAEAEEERLRLERDALAAELAERRQALTDAEAELTAMNREIERLRGRLEDLRFDWVYYVRNAPILDAFNPSLRIQQVVLNNLPMNLNFATAPRVDRCETCHLGIASAAYAGQEQPYKSHPNLELFVSDRSPHPMGEFGCTVCHYGKGRATSFASAVHTPDNESERERWEQQHGWHEVELWQWPMRTSDEVWASCTSCHLEEPFLANADRWEQGRDLVEDLGCYGCHAIEGFEDRRKRGPSLEHVASKTTPEWVYRWVEDPKAFRPETPMPKFFELANTSDSYWHTRNPVEIDAIVAYLFDAATPVELEGPAGDGDPERGRQLFETVGCQGCHRLGESAVADAGAGAGGEPADDGGEGEADEAAADTAAIRFGGYRDHGPDLAAIGSKVSDEWLADWLRNPRHYWDETVMPDLRLSESEIADLTAFLARQRHETWEDLQIPEVDAGMRDEVVLEYLRQRLTSADAEARLAEMSAHDKRLYLGEQLIGRYGCFGCHLIPGFEQRGRIGVELSDWGSKPESRLDFGLLEIPHERRVWLEQKLRSPRSYDDGKVKRPQELLRMPDFQLNSAEIDLLASTVLGFTADQIPLVSKPERTPRWEAIQAGRRIVDRYNCRTCHVIEGEGGAILDVIVDRRVAEHGETRPAAAAYAPPNLNTQGAKTQPEWLYRFLQSPSEVRPWLNVRMPTFRFNDAELNALTAYFSALDEAPYPFEERYVTAHTYPAALVQPGRRLADELQCFRCHVRGGVTPSGTPDNWAPDLALAHERLRYDWIQEWLKDPQAIFPGTRMPQYYPDLSEGRGFLPALGRNPVREIEAMAAYIMSIGQPSSERAAGNDR